jgi:hypothetical protein
MRLEFISKEPSSAAKRPAPILFVLKSNLTLSLYPLVSTPALARDGFFSPSMSEEKVRAYQARMSGESFRAFLDILLLNLPNPRKVKTPLLVMGGQSDRLFSPQQVAATASAYDTQPVMFPNMPHGIMLEDGSQQVADRIIAWLSAKGL